MKNTGERTFEGEYFTWRCGSCGSVETMPLSKDYLKLLQQGKLEFGQFECRSEKCKGTVQKHQKLEKLFTFNRSSKRAVYRPFANLKFV